jgi:Transposase IS66 family
MLQATRTVPIVFPILQRCDGRIARGQNDVRRECDQFCHIFANELGIAITKRFEEIFSTHTGYATLDWLLSRLKAQKSELLLVLERPDIPLHTNGSENDIRCQVTRRKISGGTRSDLGRCDAFLGLMKTCAKQGIRFWQNLGARLGVPGAADVPPLATLIAQPAPP